MKKYVALSLCFFTLIFCCSCSQRKEVGCFDILCELIVYSKGEIEDEECLYTSAAEEGEIGYFSLKTRQTLFGEKRVEECFPMIEDCAVFVSARDIEEIGVFKCYSRSDTDSVAAMCLERGDILSVAINSINYKNGSKKAHIEIHGKYVLYSFMDRSEAISEYFCKLI